MNVEHCVHSCLDVVGARLFEIADLHGKHPPFQTDDWSE